MTILSPEGKTEVRIYQVGGAIRDRLLGIKVKDVDWVVTGATAEQMISAGYKPVGKDFTIYLHPETGEEYALARTKRDGDTRLIHDTSVSIEEDLSHRDLTINAIAMDEDGRLIDPYGGQTDVEKRVLRHVSDAFKDDPIRVLRLARFAASLHEFGFNPVSESIEMISGMVRQGMLDELTPERVWHELSLALSTDNPQAFFTCMFECGALEVVFPEVAAVFEGPVDESPAKALMDGLAASVIVGADIEVRFALLGLHMGAASTNQSPAKMIEGFCRRWRAPKSTRELALLCINQCTKLADGQDQTPTQLLDLYERSDAFRRPDRFRQMIQTCRLYSSNITDQQTGRLNQCLEQLRGLDLSGLIQSIPEGEQVADAIHTRRLNELEQCWG